MSADSAQAAPALVSSGAKNAKLSSLTDRVYAALRAEILTCELEPGRDLSEAELAARFDVSKTPVREALATLKTEGFIRSFPRRGYQVVPITFGDINELFELRTILECAAAELACERITESELAHLSRLAEIIYDEGEQPSLKRFIDANRDFHVAIGKASGNTRLYQHVARTIDELERFFYLGARLRNVSGETRSDHHRIVDILRTRDVHAARKTMIDHNDATRQGLIRQIALSNSARQIELKHSD